MIKLLLVFVVIILTQSMSPGCGSTQVLGISPKGINGLDNNCDGKKLCQIDCNDYVSCNGYNGPTTNYQIAAVNPVNPNVLETNTLRKRGFTRKGGKVGKSFGGASKSFGNLKNAFQKIGAFAKRMKDHMRKHKEKWEKWEKEHTQQNMDYFQEEFKKQMGFLGISSSKKNEKEAKKVDTSALLPEFGILIKGEEFGPAYQPSCVTQTKQKQKIEAALNNFAHNVASGRFPYKDEAAISLSKNSEFRLYWANLREFCHTVQNQLPPIARVLDAFFSYDQWTDQNIPVLIKKVNELETNWRHKHALFFRQLAAFAIQRNTYRCPCETIVASYNQKLYPNGKTIPTGVYNQYTNFFKGKTVTSMRKIFTNLCLKKYKKCEPKINTLDFEDEIVQEL